MNFKTVDKADFIIHESPEEEIKASIGSVEIIFWDDEDRKLKIEFNGYLDMKYTKIDCFEYSSKLYRSRGNNSLEEVENSSWLKSKLEKLEKDNKLDKWSWKGEFHHYIMVFHDTIFEIIAYDNFEIEEIEEKAEWERYEYEIEDN